MIDHTHTQCCQLLRYLIEVFKITIGMIFGYICAPLEYMKPLVGSVLAD